MKELSLRLPCIVYAPSGKQDFPSRRRDLVFRVISFHDIIQYLSPMTKGVSCPSDYRCGRIMVERFCDIREGSAFAKTKRSVVGEPCTSLPFSQEPGSCYFCTLQNHISA